MLKKNLKWTISVICLLLFIFMAYLVLTKKTIEFDNSIYSVISKIKSPVITSVVKVITDFASERVLVLLTLLIFVLFKNKNIALITSLNLINVLILNQTFKHVFLRPRPDEMMIQVSGYSFPSGHSMTSLAFYGLIIYLIWKSELKKNSKYIITIILSLLILLIGLSRIYLKVHYASDVLAGFALATSYLIIFLALTSKFILRGVNNETTK